MRNLVTVLLFVITLFLSIPGRALGAGHTDLTQAEDDPGAIINQPAAGQALIGKITITGSAASQGFLGYEVLFAYSSDPTDTWFLIYESDQPVIDGDLAQWDTTSITDGDYVIRLVIRTTSGGSLIADVPGVRVRNYSPVESDTPTPITPTTSLDPSKTPAPTSTPSPPPTMTQLPGTATPLPPNPAQLSNQQVLKSIGVGVLVTVGLLAIFGLYLALRAKIKKGWGA